MGPDALCFAVDGGGRAKARARCSCEEVRRCILIVGPAALPDAAVLAAALFRKLARRDGKRRAKATSGAGDMETDTKEETVAPWSVQHSRPVSLASFGLVEPLPSFVLTWLVNG